VSERRKKNRTKRMLQVEDNGRREANKKRGTEREKKRL